MMRKNLFGTLFALVVSGVAKALRPVVASGVKSVLLFGQHEGEGKDECGTPACEMLARVAVSHVRAGADGVAPSAMMDGQIAAIRHALDKEGFQKVLLISYSTKFASQMYGPFRDAENSAPGQGDRQGYQASYRDVGTAIRESDFDEDEGADFLMVKSALFYLDLIRTLADRTHLPVMAYNGSGEYSMIHAAAAAGYCDLYPTARESLYAIFRAGATQVISYWAPFCREIFDS